MSQDDRSKKARPKERRLAQRQREVDYRQTRLAFWGMNPNRVGQSTAVMLMVAGYVALYDSSFLWRRAGYVIGSVVGILLIFQEIFIDVTEIKELPE